MNPPETSEEKEKQAFGKPEAEAESVEVLGQNELNEKVAMELCTKVANLLGWFDILRQNGWLEGFRCVGATCRSFVPRFHADLNACHEFERQFENDCAIWMDYMAQLVGKPWHFAWEANEVWNAVHATAEQRCRAFIAVMGRDDVREATESKEHGTP